MITRPKSIFTLGEEGDEEEQGKGKAAAAAAVTIRVSKSLKPASAYLAGLRILIQPSETESNVVTKSAVRSSVPASPPHLSPVGFPQPSFLEACCLCKKELDVQKDVYMYRGDQGYCSVECRRQQILLDEKRESEEATAWATRQAAVPSRMLVGHGVRVWHRRRRISVAA